MKKSIMFLFFVTSLVFGQLKYFSISNQSTKTYSANQHQMIVKDNNIFICYKRGSGSSPADKEIKVSISKDKGLTWTEKDITVENKETSSPTILANESNIIVMYNYHDVNDQRKICIATSFDNGDSFNLSSYDNLKFATTLGYWKKDLATGNNNIFIGNNDYLFLSQDNAVSFEEINTPPNFSSSSDVNLSFENNIFWVTFSIGSDSIYVYRSYDYGNSYQMVDKYFADLDNSDNFKTCTNGNKLIIVWSEEIVGVYYLQSKIIDNNSVGSTHEIFHSSNDIDDFQIDWRQNKIWVVVGNTNIFFSENNGSSWSRGADVTAEMDGFVYFGDNFHAENDTTLFLLCNEYVIDSSIRNNILLNFNWVDYPVAELKNDTLLTESKVYILLNSYVKTDINRLQLSNTTNFSNTLLDTTDNQLFGIVFKNRFTADGTKYYYRVRGEESGYQTSWAPTKSFFYGVKITETPILTTPANNSSFTWPNYINFEWSQVSNTDSYEIHISSNNAFTDTIMNWKSSDNNVSLAIYFEGTAYWHVRGLQNSTGSIGNWSTYNTFISDIASSVENLDDNIPQDFFIGNYPNPFNPSTTIRFGLPVGKSRFVNITIYDINGQKITTLLSEEKRPGVYEINWDASTTASGTFFCRIEASNKILTKKILLIK